MAALIGLALVIFAPRAGEGDRTEAVAIGTLRTIVSGEQAYASANDGYFDTPGVALGSVPGGYHVQFHPGPKAARDSGKQSPTAMTRFAVVAVPTGPRTSQRRAFLCGSGNDLRHRRWNQPPDRRRSMPRHQYRPPLRPTTMVKLPHTLVGGPQEACPVRQEANQILIPS